MLHKFFIFTAVFMPFVSFALVQGSMSLTDLNNNLAVVDDEGNLAITFSTNVFYGGHIAAHMFDGDSSTYADLNKNTAWIAVQMKSPMLLTDVRYLGRSDNTTHAKRVVGCYIQGANKADFSDAVTLHVCKPPADWNPKEKKWIEAKVDAAAANRTFTYLRIYSPGVGGAIHAGNLCELEFYVKPAPQDVAVPVAPSVSNAAWINGGVGFDLAVTGDTIAYSVAKTTQSGSGDVNRHFNFFTEEDSPIRVILPRTSLEKPSIAVTAGNMAGMSSATALDDSAYSRPLTGTASGSATAANAFDGDESTICTLAGNEAAVLDFGAVRTVSGVKLLVASDAANLKGARIEISQDEDFFDVQTLMTITTAPALGEVVELTPDSAAAGRYARLITPDACGCAEIEFSTSVPAAEPTAFSVARSELTNQYAVLSWTMPANITSASVYRAPGAGGPWTKLATVSGATTYTDSSAPVGVKMYYRLAPVVEGVDGAMSSATVMHRRCRLLDRDWNDMTKLKSGVEPIFTPENAKYYNGGSVAGSISYWFDDSVSTYGNAAVSAAGLDLGEACSLGFLRVYPRSGSQGQARFLGMTCFGSNDGDNWKTVNTQLTGPATDNTVNWKEWTSMSVAPMRYVFFSNPSNSSWNAQTAEIRFFGWSASEVATAAIGATDLTAVQDGLTVRLGWRCDASEGLFRVERSTGGGQWGTLADGLSSNAYIDDSIAIDGSDYSYRIVTVNGNSEAYSGSVGIKPYAHGNGAGLYTEYYTNYTSSAANEIVAHVMTNAQICAMGASVVPGAADATNNVLAVYSGKLIVPVEGRYRFRVQADDAVSLILDDAFVLTQPSVADAVVLSPYVSLTAGEHDIVLRHYQHDGDAKCVLWWHGPVGSEIIPQTQFVPEPAARVSVPWVGGRTFSGDPAFNFGGNVRENGDGSFDFAFAGSDLYLGDTGYTFMWQAVKGDFTFKSWMEFIGPLNINGFKGGLMMRSSLDAMAPFEAIVLRNNSSGSFATCHRTSRGGNVSQPQNIDGKSSWSVAGPKTGLHLKITRRGNVFESWFKKPADTQWTKFYRYEDTKGNYGNTVYVGPCTTFITPGSFAVDMDSNFISNFAKPRYGWRFKDMKIAPLSGTTVLVR